MPNHRKHFTYSMYLEWNEGERIELIDGHIFAMTPAPSRIHQEVLGALFTQFSNLLKGKKCRAYIAPFDIRLPEGKEADEEINTVVQPDLSVICDSGKLDERGCKGAPDLIAEVISPGSLKLDMTVKKRLYERVGVKEYWIIYPHERIVMAYVLDEQGKFTDGEAYTQGDNIPVRIFNDFFIRLSEVFGENGS